MTCRSLRPFARAVRMYSSPSASRTAPAVMRSSWAPSGAPTTSTGTQIARPQSSGLPDSSL
jgi:hypothetical protein